MPVYRFYRHHSGLEQNVCVLEVGVKISFTAIQTTVQKLLLQLHSGIFANRCFVVFAKVQRTEKFIACPGAAFQDQTAFLTGLCNTGSGKGRTQYDHLKQEKSFPSFTDDSIIVCTVENSNFFSVLATGF